MPAQEFSTFLILKTINKYKVSADKKQKFP